MEVCDTTKKIGYVWAITAWLKRMSLESIDGLKFGLFQPEALITFRTEVESRW